MNTEVSSTTWYYRLKKESLKKATFEAIKADSFA